MADNIRLRKEEEKALSHEGDGDNNYGYRGRGGRGGGGHGGKKGKRFVERSSP